MGKEKNLGDKFLDYIRPQRKIKKKLKQLRQNKDVKDQSSKFDNNEIKFPVKKGDDKAIETNLLNREAVNLLRFDIIKGLKKYDFGSNEMKELQDMWTRSTKDFMTSATGRYDSDNAKNWERDGYKSKSKAVKTFPKTIKGRILIVEWREYLWKQKETLIKDTSKNAKITIEDKGKMKKGDMEFSKTLRYLLGLQLEPNLLDVKLKF